MNVSWKLENEWVSEWGWSQYEQWRLNKLTGWMTSSSNLISQRKNIWNYKSDQVLREFIRTWSTLHYMYVCMYHVLFHIYVCVKFYVWIVLFVCNGTPERTNKISCILYLGNSHRNFLALLWAYAHHCWSSTWSLWAALMRSQGSKECYWQIEWEVFKT